MLGLGPESDVNLNFGRAAGRDYELPHPLAELITRLEWPDLVHQVVMKHNPDPHRVVPSRITPDLDIPSSDRTRKRQLVAVSVEVRADHSLFNHL